MAVRKEVCSTVLQARMNMNKHKGARISPLEPASKVYATDCFDRSDEMKPAHRDLCVSLDSTVE